MVKQDFRFCVFEIGERRERKLNRNEKPLAVQVLELMIIWVGFSKTKLTLSVPLELE